MADPRGEMLRRAALAFALALTIPLVGIPSWIALNRQDSSNVVDSDLAVDRPPLTPEADGFNFLRAAAAAIPPSFGSAEDDRLRAILAREASDPEWVDDVMRKNADAFGLLERGLSASEMEIPVFDSEEDDTGDVFLPIQRLVRLSAAHARSLAADGDTRGALRHALLGMRVSRRLGDATGAHVLALMIGAADQSISLHAIEALLGDLKLSPSEALRLARELDANRWTDEAWRRAWATEYQWFKQVVTGDPPERAEAPAWEEEEDQSLYHRIFLHLPDDYLFHRNRTLGDVAQMYRELADESTTSCRDWRDGEVDQEAPFGDDESPSWYDYGDLLIPNYWGRYTLRTSRWANSRFLTRRCHLESRVSLVQAAAAINAFSHTTGAPPATLSQLVPEYLDRVPQDRFDGGTVRYSKASRVVYSIGDDFVDDGAPENASQSDSAAPAVHLAL